MARVRPASVRGVDGMNPISPRIAFKGLLHVAYNVKYQSYIARSWPRGNGGMTPRRLLAIEKFKAMVKAAKFALPEQVNEARKLSVGTAFTWRDVVQMAASGRFYWHYDKAGRLTMGWAMAFETIQVLLDSIENTVGSILIRYTDGWVVLLPPSEKKTLVFDPSVGIPQWQDADTDAQAILDSVTPDEGAMLVKSSGAWIALEPAALGKVLTANGPGAAPSFEDAAGASSTFDAPEMRISTTDSWAAGFIILKPVFLYSGDVLHGGYLPTPSSASTASWSVGVYDGGFAGPSALCAVSGAQTGLVGNDKNYAPFGTPYTVPADGIYWVGAYCDQGASIFKTSTELQSFWSNGSGTWPVTAPAFTQNTGGALVAVRVG